MRSLVVEFQREGELTTQTGIYLDIQGLETGEGVCKG